MPAALVGLCEPPDALSALTTASPFLFLFLSYAAVPFTNSSVETPTPLHIEEHLFNQMITITHNECFCQLHDQAKITANDARSFVPTRIRRKKRARTETFEHWGSGAVVQNRLHTLFIIDHRTSIALP